MSDIQDQQTSSTQASSTFKVYAQDVWPINKIEDAKKAYDDKNQKLNDDSMNWLSCSNRVIDDGKYIAYPKTIIDAYTPNNDSQGSKDIKRCGKSFAGFAYLAKDGEIKNVKVSLTWRVKIKSLVMILRKFPSGRRSIYKHLQIVMA